MEVQNHGTSPEDSCTQEYELAQDSGCMCHKQQSFRDEAPKPCSAEMVPFHFYGLDMELQDLVFVLLDIGFALANISLLCAYSFLEWE